MKAMILGLSSLFIASILYGATLIAAAVYSGWLVEEGGLGWDSRYGVFGNGAEGSRDAAVDPNRIFSC